MKSPVSSPQRPRFVSGNLPALALLFIALTMGSGCTLLRHSSPATVALMPPTPTHTESTATPKKGLLPRIPTIPNPFANLHPFRRIPPPPKAQAPIRVGVIRTISNDGSYVIVELEPGTLVTPGRNLFVTGAGGEPVRLRAAEVHPPYFAADILGGHPGLGAAVQE